MFKYLAILFTLTAFIYSCNSNRSPGKKNIYDKDYKHLKPKYAKGFDIYKKGNISVIKIKNPWQKAENIEFEYIIYSDSISKEYLYEASSSIKIPIQTAVCLSTTHIGYLEAINKLDVIVGVSGTDFVNDEYLVEKIKNNKIKEVGYEQNINYETIINLKPDVIFAYSIGTENIGYLNKFKELNIPVFYIAEYLEHDPLGKTEWIKVVAEFFGKTKEADSIFNSIEKEYLKTLKIVSNLNNKPKVLTGLPWKGTWFVTGGKSHLANLIHDAGGQYLWRDLEIYRSEPLSLESIFQRGVEADYWINCGDANSIQDLLTVEERIGSLPVIKSGNIYNNNARVNSNGGNDYWESGVMNPHIILKDLIKVFHPDIEFEHQLYYYKKIN